MTINLIKTTTAAQIIAMAHMAGFKLVNTLKNGIELRQANSA